MRAVNGSRRAGRIPHNSLRFSVLAVNLGVEAGSSVTVSATTRFVAIPPFSPGDYF